MTWTNVWTTWLTGGSEQWQTGLYNILDNFPLFNTNISNPRIFLSEAFNATSYWFIQTTLFFTLIVLLKQIVNGSSKTSKKIKAELPRSLFDMAKLAYKSEIGESLINILRDLQPLDVNQRMPSRTSDHQMTLFLCVCISGNERVLRFMLCHGADIHAKTKWNDSPLHLVTFALSSNENRDFGAIGVLLESGCNINSKNWIGNTPLHLAASHGNTKLIKYLLEKGADPSIANNKDIYPIDFANNADNKDAADLLVFDIPNPYVWDVIEPHTPTKIKLGLQSPSKQHLIDSTFTRRPKKREKHFSTHVLY